MPPHASSLIFATHAASPLPLGAKFIWGIKNPLSLDPIDIWASISEIITASGQNPATPCSRCDDGGSAATRCDQKGAVLCLCVCVCFFSPQCVFVSLRCTVPTLMHTRGMQRWECGSVKEWFCPFCISASGALSSAWMEVWRVTVGEKVQLSLRQALPTRVSPFETQCPAYPPQSTFWLGQLLPPPWKKKKKSALPTLSAPCMRSVGNQTGRDDSSSASLPSVSSSSISFSFNQIWKWLCL